jgi:hypothetical protein
MNSLLTAIDGKSRHAFATPCNQTRVGGEDYIKPLRASGLASFIRDDSTLSGAGKGPKVLSAGFVGSSGADMIAWVKRVEEECVGRRPSAIARLPVRASLRDLDRHLQRGHGTRRTRRRVELTGGGAVHLSSLTAGVQEPKSSDEPANQSCRGSRVPSD